MTDAAQRRLAAALAPHHHHHPLVVAPWLREAARMFDAEGRHDIAEKLRARADALEAEASEAHHNSVPARPRPTR